jgi:protein SCO1
MYIENFADLPYFDRRIRGLTETPKQIAQIAKEHHVYYKRAPTDDGGYVGGHLALIY